MLEQRFTRKQRRPKKRSNYVSGGSTSGVTGSESTIRQTMEDLVQFLKLHLGYTEDEASVYLVALEKESVTSGSVCKLIPNLRPSSAKDILDRLSTKGLLTHTPRKPEQSGKEPGRG